MKDTIITLKIVRSEGDNHIFYNGYIDKITTAKTDRARKKAYKRQHTQTSNADINTIINQLVDYFLYYIYPVYSK